MVKKVRNLGFSLIELIVAFAVLGVATLGIGSLFVVATRSSSKTQEQANIYNEAQLAANQMENIIQETELAVSYRTGGTFALQDENANAAEKVLYIFNAQTIDTPELILLKWNEASNEIYYREVFEFPTVEGGGKVAVTAIPVEPSGTEDDWALLAENVSSFSATLDEENKKVFLDIQFGGKSTTYESRYTIALRNEVVINPQYLSDVTKKITEEMLAEITEVQVSISPQILSPITVGQLQCKVSGKGTLPEHKVTWLVATDASMNNIVGDSAEPEGKAIQIDKDGNISIDFSGSLRTYKGAFYVKAIATEKESGKTIESNVKEFKVVRDMKVSVAGTNYIASLSGNNFVNYQTESGVSLRMQCEVSGNGLSVYDQNVVWSIEDMAQGIDAVISADGVLKIRNYSITGTLKVVASLAQNNEIKVRFPVYVKGTHNEEDRLSLRAGQNVIDSEIQRGEETKITVELLSNNVQYDGTIINAEDCIWSISSSPWLPTDYLAVGTSGIVSVQEEVPWNREYEVTVTATWKKDMNVTGEIRLVIPATTLGR